MEAAANRNRSCLSGFGQNDTAHLPPCSLSKGSVRPSNPHSLNPAVEKTEAACSHGTAATTSPNCRSAEGGCQGPLVEHPLPASKGSCNASPSHGGPSGTSEWVTSGVGESQKCTEALAEGSYEEESISSQVLIRHRMGYSTVSLTNEQMRPSQRDELENFLMYKEQKYNSVNVLDRFCTVLLLLLAVSSMGHAVSIGSPEWSVSRYESSFTGIGVLIVCQAGIEGRCKSHASYNFPLQIIDTETGDVVCSLIENRARARIWAMFGLSILQLVCLFAAFVFLLRIAVRPSRSTTALMAASAFFASLCCGVTVCVIFSQHSRCLRRNCVAGHASERGCHAGYGWAFVLYLIAVVFDGITTVVALCLHSYVYGIQSRVRRQLWMARRRKADETMLKEYVTSMAQKHAVAGGGGLLVKAETGRGIDSHEEASGATQQSAELDGKRVVQVEFLRHGEEALDSRGRNPDVEPLPYRVVFTDYAQCGRGMYATLEVRNPRRTPPASGPLYTSVSDLNRSHPDSQGRHPREGARASPEPTQCKGDKLRERDFIGSVRRTGNFLLSLFSRVPVPDYLTAEELGLTIPGANDWVYDDRSDMYYSFDRNMFWDPLTHEYFSCALHTWHEHPDEVVAVRDAKAFFNRYGREPKTSTVQADNNSE